MSEWVCSTLICLFVGFQGVVRSGGCSYSILYLFLLLVVVTSSEPRQWSKTIVRWSWYKSLAPVRGEEVLRPQLAPVARLVNINEGLNKKAAIDS